MHKQLKNPCLVQARVHFQLDCTFLIWNKPIPLYATDSIKRPFSDWYLEKLVDKIFFSELLKLFFYKYLIF